MSDWHQYAGMDIHAALALAHKNGDQLRVMHKKHGTAPTVHMRYAFPPEDHEIQVEVADNVITRIL